MKKPELKVAGPQKLDNGDYSKQLEHMHVELNDLAKWLQHTRERLAVVIEGCHTAGKGGAIGALSDELNPRQCHTVALSKPGERELGQWYFQRYQKSPWTLVDFNDQRRRRLTMIRHLLDRIRDRKVSDTPIDFPPLDHQPSRERFGTRLEPIKSWH